MYLDEMNSIIKFVVNENEPTVLNMLCARIKNI